MLPKNQEILFTRQIHEAKRAGRHYDIRFVVGDRAYSFATKKDIPEEGQSILLYEQPVHDASYALSQRVEIPEGQYGAGVTTLDFVKKARIGENSTPTQMTIHSEGKRFLLKKVDNDKYGEKAWLFKNLPANKYLEKIATRINQYEHKTTKQKKWVAEGKIVPKGYILTDVSFYKRKNKQSNVRQS